MKKMLLALLLPLSASAQPFIEVGIGATTGGCLYHSGYTTVSWLDQAHVQVHPGCSRSPLGLIAIGYEFNDRWRIQWDHWSSIPDTRDRGMEILSIRYRYTFK